MLVVQHGQDQRSLQHECIGCSASAPSRDFFVFVLFFAQKCCCCGGGESGSPFFFIHPPIPAMPLHYSQQSVVVVWNASLSISSQPGRAKVRFLKPMQWQFSVWLQSFYSKIFTILSTAGWQCAIATALLLKPFIPFVTRSSQFSNKIWRERDTHTHVMQKNPASSRSFAGMSPFVQETFRS